MKNNLCKYSLLSMAIAASLGLVACGGSDSAAPSSNVTGVSLSGTAAKGIINKGVVVAQELNADKVVITELGNTLTGLDGSYTLILNNDYQGGPVQITLTMDADSEMKCDVPGPAGCGTRTDDVGDTDTTIDFGEWYKPKALTLTTLIPDSVANAVVSANVTPFTHMAAERA